MGECLCGGGGKLGPSSPTERLIRRCAVPSVQSTGVEYKPGGVESGLNKMEKDQFTTRLLHVKGKRVVRTNEVGRLGREGRHKGVPCRSSDAEGMEPS